MRLRFVLFAVFGGLILGYAIAAPYITVYRIRTALETNDAEALSQHVDFPAIRQSLKDELNAAMTEQAVENANPFASLGALLVGGLADRVIDALVTPAGLRRLLRDRNLESAMSGVTEALTDPDSSMPEVSMSYESTSSFAVTVGEDDQSDNLQLILKRDGLNWKLSEIRLR